MAADIIDEAARPPLDIVAAITVPADAHGDDGRPAAEAVMALFAPAARGGVVRPVPGAVAVAIPIAMVMAGAAVAIAARVAVAAVPIIPVAVAPVPVVTAVAALFELGLVAGRVRQPFGGRCAGRVGRGERAGGQADGEGAGQGTDPSAHLILPIWQACRVAFRV